MDAKKIRECAAEMIRFADSCEAKEQPPKPSQEWLDYAAKHNCRIVERGPIMGRLFAPERLTRLGLPTMTDIGSTWDDREPEMGGKQDKSIRWILERLPAATPPAGLLKGDWEHTGELREPRKLADGLREPWMTCGGDVADYEPTTICNDCRKAGYTDARRWIVRPKAKPAPKVTPWTLATVPMPLVVKSKATGTRAIVLAVTDGGMQVMCNTGGDTRLVSYSTALEVFTLDDGSPCGEVAK